jgi:Na+/H+ antiporter NhaC
MKFLAFGLQCIVCLFLCFAPLFSQTDTRQISSESADPEVSIELTPKNLKLINSNGELFFPIEENGNGRAIVKINGEEQDLPFENGLAKFDMDITNKGELVFLESVDPDQYGFKLYHVASHKKGVRIQHIPVWMSIIPPLVAILLALIFKEVVISLFLGIWSGSFIAGGLRWNSLYYFFLSIFETVEKYVINALNDSGHMSVIIFSMLIGGMVAIISKNGGMAGVVLVLSRYARSPRSAQFITWLLGVAIFFDDYANTLIVGNTMRSVTDRFKISREKLAYIVDSTAAPVAAIAFITTWIGAELGYIDDGMSQIPLASDSTPYALFLKSLKYSYYPVLTLSFMLFLIYLKRDFGSMWKAELRARSTGQVSSATTSDEDEPNMEDLTPVKNAPLRWYNAAIPVLTVIFVTMYGLVDTGITSLFDEISAVGVEGLSPSWSSVWSNMSVLLSEGEQGFFGKLGKLIGSADSYKALLWSSLSGVIVAILLTVSQGIIKLFDSMYWMATGFKTMMPALIILTLAWSLAICTHELHTADFLSSALAGNIHPYFLPSIVFILSALIAFSTGSSWSTMAILYPIALPTTYSVCLVAGIDPDITLELLLNVIATILAASVLGDHCSPISDTTILSSLASDCNHIDHVRTQLPYALTVGVVSLTCVTASAFLGGGVLVNFILLVLALLVLYLIVRKVGKVIPGDN